MKKIKISLMVIMLTLFLLPVANALTFENSGIESETSTVSSYYFLFGNYRDATLYYTTQGITIAELTNIDRQKQTLTPERIAKLINKLPRRLHRLIREVQLVDYEYKGNDINANGGIIYAISKSCIIIFYKNNTLNREMSDDELYGIILHESGHLLDEDLSHRANNYVSDTIWEPIMETDSKVNSNTLFVSEYSKTTRIIREDFADSVKGYISNKSQFANQYPNRAEYLSRYFE